MEQQQSIEHQLPSPPRGGPSSSEAKEAGGGAPSENPILQNSFESDTQPLTEKQIRRGPKTAAGRAKMRQNALDLGINSEQPVIPEFEVPELWEYHLRCILKSLRPKGYMERQLATRVALYLWRLGRVSIFETAASSQHIKSLPDAVARLMRSRAGPGEERGKVAQKEVMQLLRLRILPVVPDLDLVMRYETHLHRQYIQTLQELEAMQARRRGDQTPLARLDITGSGSS